MSKISIDLDLAVVQEALHAKVQPVVDRILSTQDIEGMIAKELEKPLQADRGGYISMQYLLMAASLDPRSKPTPLLDTLVQKAIHEAAEKFVKKQVTAQKVQIEAAFTEMLKDSPSRVAKMFVHALEDGLKNHWSFDLNTTVKAIEPPDISDYD